MTGSVEGTKDTGGASEAAAKASPEDLLKKAVAGKVETGKAEPAKSAAAEERTRLRPSLRIDARLAAVAAVALVVGTGFGLMAAPRERSGEALARIESGLDAGHSEATRLNAEVERLSRTLASLRETSEAARGEVRTLGPSLADRLTRLEQGLDKKFAALAEREQAAALSPTPEKRAAAPVAAVATTSTAVAASTPRAEPAQTGSLPEARTEIKTEAKAKPETVETWALREVYDGVAMLEDRKRRLIEVAPGETVPGVGRVEAIERRGRAWVVVTRQGVITAQTW